MSLVVVIVNWNAGRHLLKCVQSIDNSLPVTVVDNGSSDGSADTLSNCLNVRLIRVDENLGFGKACNLGAKGCQSDFILFLNPDAAVYNDSITRALSFMKLPLNEHVGICGVQLIDETGHVARSCTRFPTVIGLIFHAVGLDRIFPRLGHFMSEWPHDSTREVDHVIGAFYLVRRKVFESLSGFDERFFVYLEDLDFSLRAHQAGWKTVFLADVQAFHAGGGTSNQVKARRLFYSIRSRLLYAHKHFSTVGASAVFMSAVLLEPLSRLLFALLKRSFSTFAETISAYRMLLSWLPKWIMRGDTR